MLRSNFSVFSGAKYAGVGFPINGTCLGVVDKHCVVDGTEDVVFTLVSKNGRKEVRGKMPTNGFVYQTLDDAILFNEKMGSSNGSLRVNRAFKSRSTQLKEMRSNGVAGTTILQLHVFVEGDLYCYCPGGSTMLPRSELDDTVVERIARHYAITTLGVTDGDAVTAAVGSLKDVFKSYHMVKINEALSKTDTSLSGVPVEAAISFSLIMSQYYGRANEDNVAGLVTCTDCFDRLLSNADFVSELRNREGSAFVGFWNFGLSDAKAVAVLKEAVMLFESLSEHSTSVSSPYGANGMSLLDFIVIKNKGIPTSVNVAEGDTKVTLTRKCMQSLQRLLDAGVTIDDLRTFRKQSSLMVTKLSPYGFKGEGLQASASFHGVNYVSTSTFLEV